MSACQGARYSTKRAADCSEGPIHFEVVYLDAAGEVLDRTAPVCFTHGLAEVDRHYASGGMAPCELREIKR